MKNRNQKIQQEKIMDPGNRETKKKDMWENIYKEANKLIYYVILTCHRVEDQGFHQGKDRKEPLVGNHLDIPHQGNHLALEDKNRHRRTSTM